MYNVFSKLSYLSAAAIPLLLGCSKGPSVATAPVSGTVTYKGQPAAGAEVMFLNHNPDGRPGRATTDGSGHYELTTYVSPTVQPKGATPGDYKVTIIKRKDAPSGQPPSSATPEEMMEYAAKAQGLKVPPPPSSGAPQRGGAADAPDTELPARYADIGKTDLTATVKPGQDNAINFELKD